MTKHIRIADAQPGMKVRGELPFGSKPVEIEVIEVTGEHVIYGKILKMAAQDRPYKDCTHANFGFYGTETVEVI